jgi:predicted nucleotidyltransferase component of viral defense system
MNEGYKKQVGLLIRIIPLLYRIKKFAIHGGTAINLFVSNMPRYSVDIDVTYTLIEDREKSFFEINCLLLSLKIQIERAIPNIKVIHKPEILKLQCTLDGATVKIEVNGTKRGIIDNIEVRELCEKAQFEFNTNCKANIVSISQLYGGKIAAALSRQHPRDLFDFKYMEIDSFISIKNGLMLSLLGSDKPIIESLNPNRTDQKQALENQFKGMTNIEFTYEDFEETREDLINKIQSIFKDYDKEFILSFERGEPDWSKCCAGDISNYPSVKWKLQNILNLKSSNIDKYNEGVEKLQDYFSKRYSIPK